MRAICLAVALVVLIKLPAHAEAADLVPIGAARVDITPGYPIRLHGYLARTSESVGVQQKIFAKALAIGSDADGPAVLISLDNLGVPSAMVEEVAARLAGKAALKRERFAVCASHTHSAPCLRGVAPNIFGKPIVPNEQAAIDRYTRELTDKLEQVALAALKDRQPGTLAWAQGTAPIAMNRRTPGGPVDHALPMLRAADESGKVKAIVVAYACHCTTLDHKDNLISGDWAGAAQLAIERDNPGAIAMTVIGCGADANPNAKGVDAAKSHGEKIAGEVKRLLAGKLEPLPAAPPVGRLKRIAVPFDTLPTREELEKAAAAGGPPGYNAKTQLARLDRGEPLQKELDYPVQTWQFGDRLLVVFLAGEVVVDYSLRLKHELDASRLWVVAYSNDLPCYIPSERILREGGYEGGGAMVYYGRPTRLKPGIEQQIVSAVRELTPEAFLKGKPEADAAAMPAPLSPQQAIAAMRTKPGFRVELVAAEPLVLDPVAIDFGADGKLWVCEMRDYPTGMDGHWKPGGHIRYLEDKDGDGRYDHATDFLGDIPFPTGLMAWRKGVLVCAAPEIFYAEDTNGDGKADLKRTLFRGFATENYQARVNGLSYGLDNWVYGANGLIGGTIHGTATGKEVQIGGRDFRIKPDTGVMEPASGLTQQGRVRDDWGHWFGGNNSVLIQQYPFPDQYAQRNPRVALPGASVFVPRDPDNARLFPSSRTLERFNNPQSANRVTSACSPLVYRDNLLRDEYAGNAFVCEPVHNLVHREVLSRDGLEFAGHRAADEQASEFLSSTDNWFRPVQVRTGPDGALYVVDMYRFVIEHPRWISPEELAKLEVRAGADKGRIYRVYRDGTPPRDVPVLDKLATPALASALETPNGTVRDNVQRLLVHRADPAAAPALRKLAQESKLPECRMQALCTLDGLQSLEPGDVLRALKDAHAGVRTQAVRLAEAWVAKDPAIGASLLGLEHDESLDVRFQLALTLGAWNDARAGQALGRIAVTNAGDRWVRSAVLSSATQRPGEILSKVLAARLAPTERSALVEPLISTAAASRSAETVSRVIAVCTEPEPGQRAFPAWRIAALATLLASADRPGSEGKSLRARLEAQAERLRPAFAAARALARDETAAPAERVLALRLLGREPAERAHDLDLLGSLLEPRNPPELQAGAIRAFAVLRDDGAADRLLAHWRALGPAARGEALDALLARQVWTTSLLLALEKGDVSPAEVDAAHRQRLLAASDAATRKRAEALWANLTRQAGGRQAVIEKYQSALSAQGDATRGASTFGKVCATCHKLAGQGHEVGPDLAALTDTTPQALLTAILDPNKEVDARYASYTAALTDGRVLTGLLAAETASAITLKRQDGQNDTILRADLDELKSAGQSLMPEGLERDLTPAALADVIAFVASAGIPPKTFAGNRPEALRPDDKGVIRLPASAAAVYGDTLVFEPELGNLGYWHSQNDRAVWTFDVARAGTFTVTLEWACADESAGGRYLIVTGEKTLRAAVGGTGAGTWANYRTIFVGELPLTAGRHKLEIKPASAFPSALMDLRAVTLTPRSGSVFEAGPVPKAK